jgi:pimeloyl-ACP methyl ester carboxylesterase
MGLTVRRESGLNARFTRNERAPAARARWFNPHMEPATGGGSALVGELVREGDYWTVVFDGRELRVRHSKGLGYLAELLSRPGVSLSALELAAGSALGVGPISERDAAGAGAAAAAGVTGVESDLGPALDAAAKAAYRRRLDELEVDRQEAEAFHDPERAERARTEYDAVAAELGAALGLGGRDRRAGSPAERARLNVTRAIRAAIDHLGEHDAALGAYLTAAVTTGRACAYSPDRASPVQWTTSTRAPARDEQFEPPVTRYTESGGVSIAYQVLGEGALDIVAVPLLISHLDLFWEDRFSAAFYRRLASFGRLIMFDKRDTGLSDSAPGEPSLEHRIEDIEAVMDACGSRRAVLFGYSEGVPMSILFAATYPERVSALVLAAGAARWPSAPDYPCGRQSDEMMASIEHLAAHRWGQGDSLEWFAPAGVAGSVATRQRFARWERMAVSPSALLRIARMIRKVDVRGALPAIHMPALVIQRLDDRITPPCHGRYLAEHIPHARYFEQPGCHLPWLDDSDAMLAEIERFLAGRSLARPEPDRPEPDRVLVTIVCAVNAALGGDDTDVAAVRAEVQAHRGRLIECTSEVTLATFDSPARAVRCAAALRDVAAGAAGGGAGAFRAGVHTGEVEISAEGIAGASGDVAARVAALAGPGEILATQIVRDLVVGSGIAFADRGCVGDHRVVAVVEP